ncbi:hypothetical protein LEP1GSC192_0616 [Leptospira sp. B5-022]|nr:hypothetical protein LEP1GSC192_0616 [Leptospira sp. B5-022]
MPDSEAGLRSDPELCTGCAAEGEGKRSILRNCFIKVFE